MATRLSVRGLRREDRVRLDTPAGGPRGRRGRAGYDPDAFGRATETVARFLGTGRYLVIQSAIVIVWMVENAIPGLPHFDEYPYGFLTLVLSLQASYAAPLILLAQNRQDDRDRANLVEDRGRANRNLEDTEFLARELADVRLALGDVVTRDFLRSELRELLAELATPGEGAGAAGAAKRPSRKKRAKERGGHAGARGGGKHDKHQPEREDRPTVSEPQRPEPAHDEHPREHAHGHPHGPVPDDLAPTAQEDGPTVR